MTATAHLRVARPRVSAAQNSLGHIKRYSEVPAFERVLTHGYEPEVNLREEKRKSMMAVKSYTNKFYVINLGREQGTPFWFYLIEQVKRVGYEFAGYYTCEADVFGTLLQRYSGDQDSEEKRKQQESNQAVINSVVGESEQINWFRQLVALCMDLGATDLHVESRGPVAIIRIRRDGVMRQIREYPADICTAALAACYTLLAEERSRSEVAFNVNSVQSAMIPMVVGERTVSLRYQSHPAVSGFDAVIRILKTDSHSSQTPPTLEKLGYTDDQVEALLKALASANGGIFIAGITGSGKTTTLSAMLSRLAREGTRKIISIEDPVEYIVPGVSHLSIQRSMWGGQGTATDNPFSASMMAFLRMDPDIGMFGEIRDSVSAQMAYTAIQTGHKLLTTVHATSALGIVSRLTSPQIGLLRSDICVPDFFSALVYQALVPTNCPHCKVPSTQVFSAEHLMLYEQLFEVDPATMYSASEHGCPECCPPDMKQNAGGHNGIKGVKVSAEVIAPDVGLLDLIRHSEDIKAHDFWRRQQSHRFDQPQMRGKPSWAHTLYDVTCGLVDPYYFEHTYGHPSQLMNR
jgi:general secretion pathway protein E